MSTKPRFRFRLHPVVIVNRGIKGKRCHDCKRFRFPTRHWFHRDKNRPDGYQLYCKPCKRLRDRRSFQKHRDERQRAIRRWKAQHHEEIADWHRQYIKKYRRGQRRRSSPQDKHQPRSLDVRLCSGCGGIFGPDGFPRRGTECRDCRSKRQPKYRNPVKRALYRQNRRAREIGRISREDWMSVLDRYEHRCAYCGAAEKFTMDHVVPLVKGGTHDPSNIVPACGRCNSRKHTKVWSPRGASVQRDDRSVS